MRESGAKTKNEMLDELLPGDLCNVRPLTEGEWSAVRRQPTERTPERQTNGFAEQDWSLADDLHQSLLSMHAL